MREKVKEEWADLEAETHLLKEQLNNDQYSDNTLFDILHKIKWLLSKPLWFWELWNMDMRHLLINVRFGWKLHYTVERWYRTNEKAGLHQLFYTIWDTQNPSIQKPRGDFEQLSEIVSKIDYSKIDYKVTKGILELYFSLFDSSAPLTDMLTKKQRIFYWFNAEFEGLWYNVKG